MPKHIHAELIKAWADGAEIEYFRAFDGSNRWEHLPAPSWLPNVEYRIKPTPKPDVVMYGKRNNIKLTFSGETGELTAVELIKGDSSCTK